MNRGALTLSIAFTLAALVGGLVLIADLWLKNLPEEESAGAPAPASGVTLPTPTLDGLISEGEYARVLHNEATGIYVYWSVIGERIYMGLRSPGTGWLAIGLDPDGPMMRGADFLMGYVKDGEAYFEDHYGDTQVSHKHDVELGGSEDVLSFAGAEDENGTVIEFERALSTQDEYDKPIHPGEMFVMLAYAQNDDWTTYHGSARDTIQIDFFAPEGDGP